VGAVFEQRMVEWHLLERPMMKTFGLRGVAGVDMDVRKVMRRM